MKSAALVAFLMLPCVIMAQLYMLGEGFVKAQSTPFEISMPFNETKQVAISTNLGLVVLFKNGTLAAKGVFPFSYFSPLLHNVKWHSRFGVFSMNTAIVAITTTNELYTFSVASSQARQWVISQQFLSQVQDAHEQWDNLIILQKDGTLHHVECSEIFFFYIF